MVRIAETVLNRHPDWQWHAIGDGECWEEVRREAEKRGISDRLLFPGRINRLEEQYHRYAIYVLPSYREGLPLVLLEAKQHHLPVVSFDCLTGPAEILTDGKDGVLIPRGGGENGRGDLPVDRIQGNPMRHGGLSGAKVERFRKGNRA